jgi:site-specific DNA-methyltransferase (adenine-specific)
MKQIPAGSVPSSDRLCAQLLLGDCLELIPTLADNSIDCLISDPPYGMHYKSLSHTIPKTTVTNDGPEAWDLLDKALTLVFPKLKENSHIYIFTDWHVIAQMSEIVRKHFNLKNVLVWAKNNRTRGDLKGNYGYQHEMILYAHKGRRYLNGKRDGNVLFFKKVPTQAMLHPTEKSVDLLEYLITKSTNIGEVVLDPFCGSGSTLVAAKNLGRGYIGMEIESLWHEIAQRRLGEVT